MGKYFVDITDQAKRQLAIILKSGDKASINNFNKFL
jgi:toxin YoeB